MHALNLFAFGWQPEIRGVTTVVISVLVLCGSVYLLLATNTGARLGMLLALAGLFGWMTTMGGIWMVYGIGLKGPEPSWKPVEVVQGDLAAARTEVARSVEGWTELAEDDPGRGQASASSDEILTIEAEVFESTSQYKTLTVYERGGGTYPRWFLNFLHEPHYALVEVQPVVAVPTEPGRAAPTPVIDESQPKSYVVMLRDLGCRRCPAGLVTGGSLIIFLTLCAMLHFRDDASSRNRAGALEKASA